MIMQNIEYAWFFMKLYRRLLFWMKRDVKNTSRHCPNCVSGIAHLPCSWISCSYNLSWLASSECHLISYFYKDISSTACVGKGADVCFHMTWQQVNRQQYVNFIRKVFVPMESAAGKCKLSTGLIIIVDELFSEWCSWWKMYCLFLPRNYSENIPLLWICTFQYL